MHSNFWTVIVVVVSSTNINTVVRIKGLVVENSEAEFTYHLGPDHGQIISFLLTILAHNFPMSISTYNFALYEFFAHNCFLIIIFC